MARTAESNHAGVGRQRQAIGWPPSVVALIGCGVLIAAWYAVGLPSGFRRQVVADLLFVCLPGLAAALCWRAGRRLGSTGLSWRLIGVGCAAWGAGSLVWGTYELVLRVVAPYPSLADVGYLLFYPLCFTGMALALAEGRSDEGGLPLRQALLDGLLVFAAAAAISYQLLLAPVLATAAPSGAGLVVSLLWPAGTFALLFLSVFTLVWRPDLLGRRSLGSLVLGFAAFAVANVIYGQMALEGAYRAGHPIDLGWHGGFILIGTAALYAGGGSAQPGAGDRQQESADDIRRLRLIRLAGRTTAMIASVLVAGGLAAYSAMRPSADPAAAVTISVMVLLLALRLGYAAVQEERLAQRTRERDQLAAEAAVEEKLAHERDLLRALMDSVPDLVYFKDVASRFTRLNEPAARTLGCTDPVQVIGKTDADFFPEDGAGWVAEEQRILRDGEALVDRLVEHVSDDGERRWLLNNKVPIRDGAGNIVGLVGIGRDITKLKQAEEALRRREEEFRALADRLAHQALHDPLTGLPNRALFHDRLEHALQGTVRRGDRVAVLFLDLDGFKIVNDTHGHEVGDDLLIAVSRHLGEALRDGDTLARLGGDEFGAILEGVGDEERAQATAGRLLRALARPIEVAGRKIPVRTSIGIALSRPETAGSSDLLREADVALYRAKALEGGTAVVFEPGMTEALLTRVALEAELRTALERGQLVLHYQPIVDLFTERVVGAEALVRWHHPTRGQVLPAEFVPLAEETGLIVPLGTWVLQEACRQAAAWQPNDPAAPPFVVSVNVSAKQFGEPGLVELIECALEQTGLPPTALQLEITEHALLEEGARSADALSSLKALGVSLAIDDFGTGYSSLGYLRHLPVDILKIDRVFTQGLGTEAGGVAIVEAIVVLAHALGLAVTAEGIETAEQLAYLHSMDCDHGQGFLFGRPMPAAELLAGVSVTPSVGAGPVAAPGLLNFPRSRSPRSR